MYNQTYLEWMKGLEGEGCSLCVNHYDIILMSVLVVAALIRGREFWLHVTNFWMFVESAAAIAMPERRLEYLVQGTPDEIHIQMYQGIGVVMLFWCIGFWLLYRSTDSTVVTSQLWSSTLLSTLCLLAFAYLLTHPMKKGPIKLNESLAGSFFSSLLFTVVTAYFALKSSDWGGYSETSGHTNLHLRADFVLMMVMGVLLYALPQWVIRITTDIDKMDAFHTYLARVGGSVLIAMAIMSGRSANFLRPSDKDAHMLSHWMYFVTTALIGLYALYKKRSEVSWQKVGLQTGHDVVLIMNATGALGIDPTVFKRVLVPRVKSLFTDVRSLVKLKRH